MSLDTGEHMLSDDQARLFEDRPPDPVAPMETENAERQSDEGRGHGLPTGERDTGPDAEGRAGGLDRPGPAERNGGEFPPGSGEELKRVGGPDEHQGSELHQEISPYWVTRVPITHLDRFLGMGGDVGLSRNIVQTDDETPDQVYEKLTTGQQQLWTVAEGQAFIASAVTQIEARDKPRVLVVKYLVGRDMPLWVADLNTAFLAFARETSCEAIEALGRDGWRKTLLGIGWSKVAVVYRIGVHG